VSDDDSHYSQPDHWPELFEEVKIQVIPIEYLDSIRVLFNDGVTWDIAVANELEETDIEESLLGLMDEYNDAIYHIDFRLNLEKVKKDISRRTKFFMKKRK
jgi:hypothetical protein